MYFKATLSILVASTVLSMPAMAGGNTVPKMTASVPHTAPAIVITPQQVSVPLISMPQSFEVELNRTEVVYLPESAAAIVVGNPSVADISVHSEDTIFIVGRGYGTTNIIILNKAGQTVMNADITVVGASSVNNVRVFAGSTSKRSTYNCSPYCQPSPNLGDDLAFMGANSTQTEQISNNFASGASVARNTQTIGLANENYNPNSGAATGSFSPQNPDGR